METEPVTQARAPGPPPVVWAIAMVFLAFELAFEAALQGWISAPDLRIEVYLRLAFWDIYFDALFSGQAGEVPASFWPTFLTHAFLHGGWLHLVMNGVMFLGLGGMLANGLGTMRFLILFVVTAIGGALVFGLLASAQGPLVGASGVIFGLIGALKRWEWKYIQVTGASPQRFWRTILALVALNVLLAVAFASHGSLAWEAHLGGFLAGFLIAPLIAPNAAGPSPI